MKFYLFVLKILNGNEILALIKCHNSGTNANVDLVNMIASIKFGEILSICSQDTEWK